MTDVLVRELNRLGYQPVFLPRGGVKPPELFTWQRAAGRLVRLGPLAQLLPAAADLVPTEGPLADIKVDCTSAKKTDAAASFLENALRCIGIDAAPKVDLGFAHSKNFVFAFTGVRYRSVDPTHLYPILDQLSTLGLPADDVEHGRLHVAYEYAYATELLMRRGDKTDFHAGLSAQLDSLFDLKGKASVAMSGNSTISFKGKAGNATAFAYKAAQLVRENGHWTLHAETVQRAGLVESRQPYLPAPGVVAAVED